MNNWTEQQTETREVSPTDSARAKLFEEVKKESLPVVQKEAAGVRPFEPVEFQPIKGVGTFEGEFGKKGEDLIYHIWPWGYHDADRQGQDLPSFKSNFKKVLNEAASLTFGENRCEISFDADIGAWFLRAKGHASSQFFKDLCVELAGKIHSALGGKS